MSNAPERIWAGNWLADVGETAVWDIGEWRNEPWPTVDVVEYVRADRIEELSNCVAVLEAKLTKAVKAIEQMQTASDAMMLYIARTTLEELKGETK